MSTQHRPILFAQRVRHSLHYVLAVGNTANPTLWDAELASSAIKAYDEYANWHDTLRVKEYEDLLKHVYNPTARELVRNDYILPQQYNAYIEHLIYLSGKHSRASELINKYNQMCAKWREQHTFRGKFGLTSCTTLQIPEMQEVYEEMYDRMIRRFSRGNTLKSWDLPAVSTKVDEYESSLGESLDNFIKRFQNTWFDQTSGLVTRRQYHSGR